MSGGLVVSDAPIENAGPMREIPAGTFIFGSSPARDPHPIGSAEVKPVVDKAASVAAALRALNGLAKPKICADTKLTEVGELANVRTTPSHLTGKSDQADRWRRAPLCETPVVTPSLQFVDVAAFEQQQQAVSEQAVRRSTRSTTTPSAHGTADRPGIWRRKSVRDTSPDCDPAPTSPRGSIISCCSSSSLTSLTSNSTISAVSSSSRTKVTTKSTTPSERGTADRKPSWRRGANAKGSPGEQKLANTVTRFAVEPSRSSIDKDMLAQALANACGQTTGPVAHISQPAQLECEC